MAWGRIRIVDAVADFLATGPSGRKRLLALTYEFDPNAFERQFSRLFQSGVAIDVVLGAGLHEPSRHAAYGLWQARWSRLFHPKLLVALKPGAVGVGVGSANLTWSGLSSNLELWQFWAEPAKPLLSDLARFLTHLRTQRVLSERMALDEILSALPAPSAKPKFLLSSLEKEPLADQVTKRVGRAHRLEVISPIHGGVENPLIALTNPLGVSEVHLYTDVVPDAPLPPDCKCFVPTKFEFDDDSTDWRPSVVHAKAYAFQTGARTQLYWGSANLSDSAWQRKGNQANIELLVRTEMEHRVFMRMRDAIIQWRPATKKDRTKAKPILERLPGWQLLQLVRERGRVYVESSRDGARQVSLRRVGDRVWTRERLTFLTAEAELPKRTAQKLGLFDSPPPFLEYLDNQEQPRLVGLNFAGPDATSAAGNILEGLLALYTGGTNGCVQPFTPRPGLAALPPPGEGESFGVMALDDDEDEFNRSEHHGELDTFVATARRLARVLVRHAQGNARVWEHSKRHALDWATKASERPLSSERSRYFLAVLEGAWHASRS